MHTVNEIISILEKINITKELLETTRLGKHVNELRRKTSDPTLARRAKVLVKRWRDLVIPTRASPAHTGSNRSSAERTVRRLGGTPLTSPALSLSRQVVSPAVPSPRPPSRPAWGGYESDSQDVILVDDDPPAPPAPAPAPAPALSNTWKPTTPPVKRPPSPEPVHDEKKSKRDKKPKKRRGHSRAGSGTETTTPAPPPPAPASAPAAAAPPPAAWSARNGSHERRRNGCRRDPIDPYAALVNRIPAAGSKKVRTTKELLKEIQSRGSVQVPSPGSAGSQDDDVVVVEDTDSYPVRVDSPLRNGGGSRPPSPMPPSPPPAAPLPPLEDERPVVDCTCGKDEEDAACPAAARLGVLPYHVLALHHAYLPGVNGTRAPTHPHQFAVRKLTDPERPDLFTSVVPLYKYSDYADDYVVKNMSRVPLCTHLPWTEFAPPPPDPPPPPSPPPLRPYPVDTDDVKQEIEDEESQDSRSGDDVKSDIPELKKEVKVEYKCSIEPEIVSLPNLEPSERLKAPLLSTEDATQFGEGAPVPMDVADEFKCEQRDHRTVERTKVELDGRTLYALCETALTSVPYTYAQTSQAPVVTLPREVEGAADGPQVLQAALGAAAADSPVDQLGRPPRPHQFTEWHECAKLGDLIALPYVVID
ncbi:uncharacterized protein LOC126377846 isoform X2 [Pectinophora gossypiella]|nr:uncharacterized protein LOC126377846 isoform X2 [Pectinophora gossypiella]